MKKKLNLKNLLIFSSIIFYISFLLVEQNHNCDGDGCLICLTSSIIRFVANCVLVFSFIPFIIEKISLLINLCESKFKVHHLGKKVTENKLYNPINNKEVNLTTFCIALK